MQNYNTDATKASKAIQSMSVNSVIRNQTGSINQLESNIMQDSKKT